jgi:hypothetical protein
MVIDLHADGSLEAIGSYIICDPTCAACLEGSDPPEVEVLKQGLRDAAMRGEGLLYQGIARHLHLRIYIDEPPAARLMEHATAILPDRVLRIPSAQLCAVAAVRTYRKKQWLGSQDYVPEVRPFGTRHAVPSGIFALDVYELNIPKDDLVAQELGPRDAAVVWRIGLLGNMITALVAITVIYTLLTSRNRHGHRLVTPLSDEGIWYLVDGLILGALILLLALIRNQRGVKAVLARHDQLQETWPDQLIVLRTISAMPEVCKPAILSA